MYKILEILFCEEEWSGGSCRNWGEIGIHCIKLAFSLGYSIVKGKGEGRSGVPFGEEINSWRNAEKKMDNSSVALRNLPSHVDK